MPSNYDLMQFDPGRSMSEHRMQFDERSKQMLQEHVNSLNDKVSSVFDGGGIFNDIINKTSGGKNVSELLDIMKTVFPNAGGMFDMIPKAMDSAKAGNNPMETMFSLSGGVNFG